MSVFAHKQFYRNISWLSLTELCFKLLSFVFFIAFTRTLGEQGLGEYTYLFSVLSLVMLSWDLGVSTYYQRLWASEPAGFNRDIRNLLGTRLALIAVSLAVFVPYVLVYDRALAWPFVVVILICVCDAVRALPVIYLQSQNNFRANFIINVLDRIIGYGGAIVVLILHGSLLGVLLALLAGRFVSMVVAHMFQGYLYMPTFSFAVARRIVLSALPLFFMALFSSIYFRVDSIMIRHLLEFEVLGFYSAAYKLLDITTVLTAIFSAASFPILISLLKSGAAELRAFLSQHALYLCIVGLFVACELFLYAPHILDLLYGPRFAVSSSLILRYLAPSLICIFLNSIAVQYLVAARQEGFVLKVFMSLTVLNILLNFWLIPRYGIVGAAVSTFVCELANTSLLYWRMPVRLKLGDLGALAAITAVCVFATWALPLPWLVRAVLGGLLYVGAGLWFGLIKVSDLRLLARVKASG
jgi:O-antigen/teichoic acid export membrane protein